jgi:hypothetical protein
MKNPRELDAVVDRVAELGKIADAVRLEERERCLKLVARFIHKHDATKRLYADICRRHQEWWQMKTPLNNRQVTA